MNKKITDLYYNIVGPLKRIKIKNKSFTIISNNCFAGIIYRNNKLPYQSPTCGLYIMPDDYIKFIYNMKEYLNRNLVEINKNQSKYSNRLNDYYGVIGRIDDIEIMFLHYKDFKEAKEKWDRRKTRINYNRIIYKFNDQNGCTLQNLRDFNNFDAKNKLCFTAKKYEDIDSIVFDEFEKEGYVVNDSKESIYSKYIDMYRYINNIKEG